jgi:patatin-like phospholipase/acyl hydrolase
MPRAIKILTIDGGGIRGLIPARVLVELESLTGRPVAETFDIIAGTSTGGMVALGLSRPSADSSPALSAQDVLDTYVRYGSTIFPRAHLRSVRSLHEAEAAKASLSRRLGALARPRRYGNARYSPAGLEAVLSRFLGETCLADALTDVIIPTYDWKAGRSLVFRSREAREGSGPNPTMALLARATTAAPTYFPPVHHWVDGREVILIDGGFIANNPASIAYYEALCLERLLDEEAAFFVLSLGTGRPPEMTPTYEEIWSRDWLELAMGMLGVAFDGTSEVVDDLLGHIIGGRWRKGRYWRVQTDLYGVNLDLDDASDGNISALLQVADRLVAERREELTQIASKLVGGRSRKVAKVAEGHSNS